MLIRGFDLDVGDRIMFEGNPGEIVRITLDDTMIAPVRILVGSEPEGTVAARPEELTVTEKTTKKPKA